MKSIIADILENALAELPELAGLTADLPVIATIERTRDANHGDFASNVAMRLAKPAKMIMTELKKAKLVTPTPFDDKIEWTFFELWHHEGRRARHGKRRAFLVLRRSALCHGHRNRR